VLAAVLAAVAGLLCSCAVGPSMRPPVAVRGSSAVDGVPRLPAPPAPPAGPALPVPDTGNADAAGFIDCTEDIQPVLPVPIPSGRALRYECTDIPIDSDDSSGRPRQSSISLTRISLTDQPPDARPPLLVLGDSDGETGTLRAARLAAQVPLALLQHFSLVGMDRRGEGTSRLDCAPSEVRSELLDADLVGTDLDAVQGLLDQARKAVQECSLTEGEALTKYDTADTARDVEQARGLLGVRTLSAIGLGDGARALAVWAQNSPHSVGRLVLDSPPDPTQDAIGAADARATAAEATFDAFGKDCDSRPGCPLGANPRAGLIALVTKLRDQPLAGSDGELLTSGAMLNAVLLGLDDPKGWPALATALGAANNGDPNGVLGYLDGLLGLNGRFDLALATRCNDTAQRVSPPQVAQLIGRWNTAHPIFGGLMAQQLLYCSAWPVPTDPAKVGPADAAPPMLVLASALSPRVPPQGYQRAADLLVPAKLVNWQGAGQGAYPRTSCVTNAVDSLLVSGVIPQASILCPP
jgi:pimeloyl-ACP methyl ester carboxylesterase